MLKIKNDETAENENELAQYNLEINYQDRIGFEKDKMKAYKYYNKSAEKEYNKAQNILGTLYENGEIIEKDLEKAFDWYNKAAENGNELAQYNLGKCYHSGIGVEKDEIKLLNIIKNQLKMEIMRLKMILHYYMKMVMVQKRI